MRKLAFAIMLGGVLAACSAATATTASAAPGVLYGIQDDAWLRYDYQGSLTDRVLKLKNMGVGIVRFTLHWNEVAPTKPADARDPDDAAYDWKAYDEIFGTLHTWKMPVLVTIYGTPKWANGGKAANWAPTSATSIAGFAYAAQKRYSYIHDWTIWNEPNKAIFLRPTSPVTYTARLLNPAYAALHSASSSAKVAGGVTAPRAGSGGVSPVAWIRGMGAAHAKLDVYAHHPYPVSAQETPFTGGCKYCTTITMATLPRLLTEVHKAFGPSKRIWLTEYAYQVNPPDRFGVSAAKQAQYEADAARRAYQTPGVDMLIHFLYRDEPNVAAWQSGFLTVKNAVRPALRSFELPLSEVSRKQVSKTVNKTVVWGQVRTSTGRRPFRLQQFKSGGWRTIGSTRLTNARGVFSTTINVPKGAKIRLYSNRTAEYSPTLVVT
jgi:hypothetical protein